MAYQNLLTNGSKVTMIGEIYYSPNAVLLSNQNNPLYTTYCFLGKVGPWPNDANPPLPTQDQSYLKQVFKRIFAVKKLTSNNISPVIPRIDWTANTVYDYYQDSVYMGQKDINGNLVYSFYVKNKYDQVFKCLWNNNGRVSTDEPYFEPGSYNTNNVYIGPNDGYKWKYMYVIDSGKKNLFMDSNWMPVPLVNFGPNPLVSSAGYGNIDVINLTNSGNNYNQSVTPITVTIVGDGTGATAVPVTSNNTLIDIQVTGTGTNYTYANVIINGSGTGAIAIAPVSPIGGHGFDPISELACSHVMYSVEFNGSEGGLLPTGTTSNPVEFHQIGLLVNPVDQSSSPNPANTSVYSTTTDVYVASGSGSFTNDEIVYQSSDQTLANATFSATVLFFDPGTNVIYTINTTGTLTSNKQIYGQSSGTARTVLTSSLPTFEIMSGYISYIENLSAVQRSADGIEQFRFVLSL